MMHGTMSLKKNTPLVAKRFACSGRPFQHKAGCMKISLVKINPSFWGHSTAFILDVRHRLIRNFGNPFTKVNPLLGQQPLVDQGLLIVEVSRSHSGTPQSVGLLWTSDQPDAGTSTWQNTTLSRVRRPVPGGIRTHNPSKASGSRPTL